MESVFQLISLMDTRLPHCTNEKIELAVLWFLDQFRKTYVGDQLQRTSKVGFYYEKALLRMNMDINI
jgi:hypothetical protein